MSGSTFRRCCRLFLFAALFLANLTGLLRAQPKSAPAPSPVVGTTSGESIFSSPDKGLTSDRTGPTAPIERPVDPTTYRLGPNDQLLLSIPFLEAEVPLYVTLDNSLALPRGFGLINVGGMTLADLRRTVDSLYRSRSRNYAGVGVVLMKPRSIYVTVRGDVVNPNRFVLTAANLVTTAIDMANQIPDDLSESERLQMVRKRGILMGNQGAGTSPMLPRHVSLRHNDGTTRELDLLRYQTLGDQSQNPTLREGDEIIVKSADPAGSTVAITGAVNSPTSIPYDPGDNALMLLRMSSGIRFDASPRDARLIRLTGSGITSITLDLTDTATLAATPLMPGDQLVVSTANQVVTGRAGVVAVTGEVTSPNSYSIVPGVTRLSDVIERAGGFTSNASLNGAYITRMADPRVLQNRQIAAEPVSGIATSSLKLEDTTRFKYDIELQQNRVSADFVAIFEGHDASRDVVLENGDQIVVPRNPGSIYVRGRVAQPGWIAYKPGADYEYYIASAGGFTGAADKSRVGVEKFGTGVWEEAGSTSIRPGDKIYVPGERDTPARTGAEVAATYVGITSSLIFLVVQVIQFIQAQGK
jgi:protein involved in polysaccharide export with SLBB domain